MQAILSLLLFAVLVLGLQLPAPSSSAAGEAETVPEFTLIVPDNEGYRAYLGLKGEPGETFSLKDIDADVLLIELFSMYCPFCQEEAANVNSLYEAMLGISTPGFSVKIIGLGANNSAFEIDHFRTTYDIKFPLFPDQDLSIFNLLGGKGTPGFIGCRRNADSTYSVVLRQSGGFFQVEEFLNELLQKSGYNQKM